MSWVDVVVPVLDEHTFSCNLWQYWHLPSHQCRHCFWILSLHSFFGTKVLILFFYFFAGCSRRTFIKNLHFRASHRRRPGPIEFLSTFRAGDVCVLCRVFDCLGLCVCVCVMDWLTAYGKNRSQFHQDVPISAIQRDRYYYYYHHLQFFFIPISIIIIKIKIKCFDMIAAVIIGAYQTQHALINLYVNLLCLCVYGFFFFFSRAQSFSIPPFAL